MFEHSVIRILYYYIIILFIIFRYLNTFVMYTNEWSKYNCNQLETILIVVTDDTLMYSIIV